MSKYTIIVADDTPEINNYYEEILSERGFEIHTAEKGLDLLNKYGQTKADLIIMDTLDSEINRELQYPEVINILREMNPDVKILFASGLNVNPKNFEEEYKVPFLAKPFQLFELYKKISELLKDDIN